MRHSITVLPLVSLLLASASAADLWKTTFTGSTGDNRNLINTGIDTSFTDSLNADDFGLLFEDTTFTGTVFMHSGAMASGTYYSPRTNVDNPAVASPQNGGWWQADFRYSGGAQTFDLSGVALEVTWSNSGGNIQTSGNNFGTSIRDVTLSLQYSLDGGVTWTEVAAPQTYDVTEPDTQDQIQVRTFNPVSAITVNHATQDLWLRVRAQNAGATIGGYVDIKSVTFQGAVIPSTGVLWTTNFSGADGNARTLVQNYGDSSFTDTLAGADANLTFEDTTFTGSVFMHSGNMGSGRYYSPRTNVDNPTAADPQNGGWWQTEFRYSGGTQAIELSSVTFETVWSNSTGNIQTLGNSFGVSIRDILLTAEYSTDNGNTWTPIASPQTYDVTEPDTQDQIQYRTFTPTSPIPVDHATQDLWLRVKAENTGFLSGGYVNIKSIAFNGTAAQPPNDYATWAQSYPSSDLSDPHADLDGDGVSNNEERLWGMDPTSGSNASPITSGLHPSTRTLTFTRRSPALTGAAFSYLYSTTLSGWTAFEPVSVTATGTSPVESVTIEVPAEIMGPKFFVRVLATEN